MGQRRLGNAGQRGARVLGRLGHVVTGLDVTLLSLFGLVACTGVVVNDSLVMVDSINERRKSLPDLHAAVRAAGAERFRPIC